MSTDERRTRTEEVHRLLEAREGLETVGTLPIRDAIRSLVRSLPTVSHARRLFDAVGARLGERGFLDPAGGDVRLRWYVQEDDGWYRRLPLIELLPQSEYWNLEYSSDLPGPILPSDAPPGWTWSDGPFRDEDPDPQIVPPGLSHCALALYEGPAWIEIRYDKRGVAKRDDVGQSATDPWTRLRHGAVRPFTIDPLQRPPGVPPISLVSAPDLDPAGHTIEALADRVLRQDPARDPVRVWLPEVVPGGIEGTWDRACRRLRELFWEGIVPADARRVVVDGFDGSAAAWGATLEEVSARWEIEVWKRKPRPPEEPRIPPELLEPDEDPPPPAEEHRDEEKGTVTFSTGPRRIVIRPFADLSWPKAIPENVPAATIALPEMPSDIPAPWRAVGFTSWRRVLDEHGAVSHVLVREGGPEDLTLVGEGVLDAVDPETLDAQIEEQRRLSREDWPESFGEPPWIRLEWTYETCFYSAWDRMRRVPAPLASAGSSWNPGPRPRDWDGAALKWRVTRMRRLTAG